ncbi:hypothetical protein REC12_16600 [Desulfosporosinus sp. PR]|nr:hypothetical protein [Desulfosporosinus sp. PR]
MTFTILRSSLSPAAEISSATAAKCRPSQIGKLMPIWDGRHGFDEPLSKCITKPHRKTMRLSYAFLDKSLLLRRERQQKLFTREGFISFLVFLSTNRQSLEPNYHHSSDFPNKLETMEQLDKDGWIVWRRLP